MTDTAVRVLIVDDHPLIRRGLQQLLLLDSRFQLVAEASNGMEALALARETQPDLLLLDLNMKGLSGLETLQILRSESLPCRVVILTVSDSRSDFFTLLDAGIDGYLLKDAEPEQMLAQIIHVAEGGQAFSDSMQIWRDSRAWEGDPFAILTARELDVLKEVARGLSNKEVSVNLSISEQTVKVHIRSVLRKLNVRSRVAATVLWLESHQ
ncbi:response regulator [Erwinia sp. JUb26]|uniref:response regulator n=1 Tax=Erwinia sp. JUb26 TaxID=2485126 RepID=UPI000F46D30A|nr:response regulator [Erwinia sp. JUb26]ROR04685.1 LuxR family two component transcriptional regulator [Erwinia sp. JUb26]